MLNLSAIKTVMEGSLGRTGLLISKHAPEIMLGTGIVGVAVSTIMACKATLKVDEIRKETKEKIDKVSEAILDLPPEKYSTKDAQRDLTLIYTQSAVKYVKLYAPSATLGVASIALILGSHGILSKRNAAMAAAYKIVDESFRRYRERVINELGVDKDRAFRDLEGGKEFVLTSDNEGLTVKNIRPHSGMIDSEYAKWFDENSGQWRKTRELNLYFLTSVQNHLNDILNTRGHVFLNEAYDALDIPRTRAGAVVGWVKNGTDRYIDFGIYNPINEFDRDAVNGYTNQAFLLDFNVDGLIYNLI